MVFLHIEQVTNLSLSQMFSSVFEGDTSAHREAAAHSVLLQGDVFDRSFKHLNKTPVSPFKAGREEGNRTAHELETLKMRRRKYRTHSVPLLPLFRMLSEIVVLGICYLF